MSDTSMQLIPNATFSLLEESVAVKNAPASVATGQSDETLALFAGIHKSRQFSVAAAHQSFAQSGNFGLQFRHAPIT